MRCTSAGSAKPSPCPKARIFSMSFDTLPGRPVTNHSFTLTKSSARRSQAFCSFLKASRGKTRLNSRSLREFPRLFWRKGVGFDYPSRSVALRRELAGGTRCRWSGIIRYNSQTGSSILPAGYRPSHQATYFHRDRRRRLSSPLELTDRIDI